MVEVASATGARTYFDPTGPARRRPQGMVLRTRLGEGFADSSFGVVYELDRDNKDVGLLDDVTVFGVDGSTASEGRVTALPRAGNTLMVQLAGHMAQGKDRKVSEIIVDRDMNSWHGPSTGAKANEFTAGYYLREGLIQQDEFQGLPAVVLRMTGPWAASPAGSECVMFYGSQAGPKVRSLYVNRSQKGINYADTSWNLRIYAYDRDDFTGGGDTLSSARSDLAAYFTAPVGRTYFAFDMWNTQANGNAAADYDLTHRKVAVYGDHGLTIRGSVDPGGFYASDVIRYLVEKYCPNLNTTGVVDTTYVIPHLVFDQVFPYDALLEINKFHLWNLAVYDDKTLYFEPFDLANADWEVRLTDPGVEVELQGDSTDSLANGIVVTYTDVATGVVNRITPDQYAELTDASLDNPVNEHGLEIWTDVELSSPTTLDGALQIGRILLAEYNTPRQPGTIRFTGHVRDRYGHWQQGWKVRSGQTISIIDRTGAIPAIPRRVTETEWNDETKQMSITIDGPPARIEAVLDRLATALQANNLT